MRKDIKAKRLICLIMVCLFIAAAFVGCGSGDKGDTDGTTDTGGAYVTG